MNHRLPWKRAVLCCPAMLPTAADAVEPAASLRVPADHSVEVAAAAPLVAHPLMADFDDEGRLYVAASAGK